MSSPASISSSLPLPTSRTSFCGIQVDPPSLRDQDYGEVLDRVQSLTPLNAILLFHGNQVRFSPDHHGGTPFRQPQRNLGPNGEDILDRLEKAGEPRNVGLYVGIGEEKWGYHADYPGYSAIAIVDCYGRTGRLSCVNHPVWRAFQLACIEDMVREHPFLAGLMFMHERNCALSTVFNPAQWQAGRNPWCFCPHCRALGAEKGIDAQRARMGYQHLLELFEPGRDKPVDGYFLSFWRALLEYPEILAWEKLMYDSLHDYRAAVAGTARMVKQEIEIGFHFQNATSTYDFFWRAGDNIKRVVEYADWVKPCVYPAVSGLRYHRGFRAFHSNLLADMPEDVAHAFLASVFTRDRSIGADMLSKEYKHDASDEAQGTFPMEWVRLEVERLVKTSSKPVYAGLGIGVPGGEKVETPEYIAECTQACYDGGAHGMLLSRHLSEMRPELLQAAGHVIRQRQFSGAPV